MGSHVYQVEGFGCVGIDANAFPDFTRLFFILNNPLSET